MPVKKSLGAEDYPYVYPRQDGSFFKKEGKNTRTRQGQMANREAKGLGVDTGMPNTLVHSRKTYDDAAIERASSPIATNARMARGKFTKEDEKTGKLIDRAETDTRKAFYKSHAPGKKMYETAAEFDKALTVVDARYKRDFNKSRGFAGKR